MRLDDARQQITALLGAVSIDGHFDKCFANLKETQQDELFVWLRDCVERRANPIQSKRDREVIGFVKRFGSDLRAILTKKKDGYFLALFLDKHKYYEDEMARLGF